MHHNGSHHTMLMMFRCARLSVKTIWSRKWQFRRESTWPKSEYSTIAQLLHLDYNTKGKTPKVSRGVPSSSRKTPKVSRGVPSFSRKTPKVSRGVPSFSPHLTTLVDDWMQRNKYTVLSYSKFARNKWIWTLNCELGKGASAIHI